MVTMIEVGTALVDAVSELTEVVVAEELVGFWAEDEVKVVESELRDVVAVIGVVVSGVEEGMVLVTVSVELAESPRIV